MSLLLSLLSLLLLATLHGLWAAAATAQIYSFSNDEEPTQERTQLQCYMCDWFALKQYSTSALKCSVESYSHIDKTKFKIIGRGVLVSKGETKQEEE